MGLFSNFTPQDEMKHFRIKRPKLSKVPKYDKEDNISDNINDTVEKLKYFLHFPESTDVKFRFFDSTINDKKYNSFIFFYDGLTDSKRVDTFVLKPLMNNKCVQNDSNNLRDILLNSVLIECQITEQSIYKTIIEMALQGNCILFIDTINKAFVIDIKNVPQRNVAKSENEMAIYGPSEAFIEQLRINMALIRKFVKDENLIFESLSIGTNSKTICSIAYMSNITNDSLINEVRRRIEGIEIDYIIDSGQLMQLIEDKTYITSPLILITEKPDKVAAHLIEGRVAILLAGTPNVLIVPAIFTDFIKSEEDSYIRYPYSTLLRFFRIPAILFSVLLPGFYAAIALFHQEMIPTDLIFALVSAREKVPLPMLLELLIMEIFFEIIREASIRTPAPIGPTLGIVGTLILGQAIVSANVVSPILIIIVALTGISSFTIPNFSLSYSFRILRFIYIFLGAFAGFFGISIGIFAQICILSTTTSFGVPYLSPIAPLNTKELFTDNIISKPLWKQEYRPEFLKTKKIKREPPLSRKWIK